MVWNFPMDQVYTTLERENWPWASASPLYKELLGKALGLQQQRFVGTGPLENQGCDGGLINQQHFDNKALPESRSCSQQVQQVCDWWTHKSTREREAASNICHASKDRCHVMTMPSQEEKPLPSYHSLSCSQVQYLGGKDSKEEGRSILLPYKQLVCRRPAESWEMWISLKCWIILWNRPSSLRLESELRS